MAISISDMRAFLGKSYSSVNANKVNGIYAEVDFGHHIQGLGYGDRISPGGWIIRPSNVERFGVGAVALFPETVAVGVGVAKNRIPPTVPVSVDQAAALLRNAGIRTYYAYAYESPEMTALDAKLESDLKATENTKDAEVLAELIREAYERRAGRLNEQGPGGYIGMLRGEPHPPEPRELAVELAATFQPKTRRYNYLRYHSEVAALDDETVRRQFSLESLRIYSQGKFHCEVVDIDGLIWGQRSIYPVEVKEKTRVLSDRGIGDWFGLDVGPFAKLAFFKAWYSDMDSLFIVREIEDVQSRTLVQWWAATSTDIARHASWVFSGGGPNMLGGASAVIRIPMHVFRPFDAAFLADL